eukprot:CAMPEP_0182572842 /NCGR_PEP_ID=MMETSP1324-20130603/17919_1 /TAXON_ID=236786 /ORGANISM="Florenciella sp., Strain RCC1587" /LENGTH=222 /DNA_ID=CAMNT_0024787857 /DNA_START=822 /DNA_END=1488 /DNA_ORIENTATION=+
MVNSHSTQRVLGANQVWLIIRKGGKIQKAMKVLNASSCVVNQAGQLDAAARPDDGAASVDDQTEVAVGPVCSAAAAVGAPAAAAAAAPAAAAPALAAPAPAVAPPRIAGRIHPSPAPAVAGAPAVEAQVPAGDGVGGGGVKLAPVGVPQIPVVLAHGQGPAAAATTATAAASADCGQWRGWDCHAVDPGSDVLFGSPVRAATAFGRLRPLVLVAAAAAASAT